MARRSFNADTESIRSTSLLALNTVKLFHDAAESKEGVAACNGKRRPDFDPYRQAMPPTWARSTSSGGRPSPLA